LALLHRGHVRVVVAPAVLEERHLPGAVKAQIQAAAAAAVGCSACDRGSVSRGIVVMHQGGDVFWCGEAAGAGLPWA
jgi:hypothetical protein